MPQFSRQGTNRSLPAPETHNTDAAAQSTNSPISRFADAQKRLGEKIRAAREQKALTPEKLAKDCAVSSTEIAIIEAGKADVTLGTLVRIAQRLEITVEGLLEGI